MSYTSLLSALALATPANAKDETIKRQAVPEWVTPTELMAVPENASGLLFMRRQDYLVHLDKRGQAQYNGFRIKILHPNALQLGNLGIEWNSASGPPVVHYINVYRDGEVIDVLKTASFEILRREGQLEAAMLDGNLTAVLRVPDLRVGDELEFAYTVRVDDPTLGTDDAGLMVLAPVPAPGRIRMALSWDKGQKPALKITPDIAANTAQTEQGIEFRFDNPPVLTPPKDAPGRYLWNRVIEYSDFADWPAVSRTFAALFANAGKLAEASPLKKEASRIAAAHPDQLGRASAALKLVQQDVRYVYVGLNGGNLTPATADQTWQRRYGDCKGKTALLLALLGELGIEAEAVLVNSTGNDDGLDERLPSPRLFDHVLVRVRIDGTAYYLDGTLPPVASPSAEPVQPYRWILPLTAPGASLELMEWHPFTRPQELNLYQIDASAGFDEPAQITTTTILRGVKGLQAQVQLSALTPDELLSGMRQELIGNTWQEIDSAEWHYDMKARASVLRISGKGKVDWDLDGDGARSLALPGGGFSPPERRVRGADQDQDLPFFKAPEYDCNVTTVRLPAATRLDQWRFNSGYDEHIFGQNYYRAFDVGDDSITMVRGFRTEMQEISAASAREDNDRIVGFDNSMAWVFFDPARKRALVKTGDVPATSEIDWTADNVPRLGQQITH